MGESTIGIRLREKTDDQNFVYRIFTTPGAYGFCDGSWYCCTPNGLAGNLKLHQVEEHEDGTISVSPSIEVSSGPHAVLDYWHGFLKRGIWTEC